MTVGNRSQNILFNSWHYENQHISEFCVLLGLKAALQQNGLGIQYLHNKEHICTYAYVTVFII